MADYSIEDKEEMIKANVARLNAHKSRLQELIEFIKVSRVSKNRDCQLFINAKICR